MSEVYITCPYRKLIGHRLARIHNRQAAYATYPLVRMIGGKTNIIETILPNEPCNDLVFERICSMDYAGGKLYIPDCRKDAPKTLVIAERA